MAFMPKRFIGNNFASRTGPRKRHVGTGLRPWLPQISSCTGTPIAAACLALKQSKRFAMKVLDAMTSNVQLCTPDDTLRDAAEAMAALNCGLLPVTNNDRLVGMISDRDIAIRGVAMGRGPDARIGDIMTSDVKYCFEDQDLDEVCSNMGDIQV